MDFDTDSDFFDPTASGTINSAILENVAKDFGAKQTEFRKQEFFDKKPSTAPVRFKNFSYKILVMRANFGEFWKFWSISTSKFWKSLCHGCAPILGQIFENFVLAVLVISQSYDKPPWRNFEFFVKYLNFGENRKFEILNPSTVSIGNFFGFSNVNFNRFK